MSWVRALIAARPRLAIIAVALALRWGCALASYAVMGLAGLKGPDSRGFLNMAVNFADQVSTGQAAGWNWLGPDIAVMPLFTWVLSAFVGLAGEEGGILAYVAVQGAIDTLTCLLTFEMARITVPRAAPLAGLVAALSPTMVVMAGLVYTDTLFVLFGTVSLAAVVRWIDEPAWRWALLAGVGFGLAALTRAMVLAWALPLVLFVLTTTLILRRPLGRTLLQLAVAGLIGSMLFAPVPARNLALYDAISPSPQAGVHLAYWIVPLVQEAADGTPHEVTIARMRGQYEAEIAGMPEPGPFEQSERLSAIGAAALTELGPVAIAKAWALGAVINLGAPIGTIVPAISALPRTGFYATPGASPAEKVWNFLFRSDNALFAWITLIGGIGVVTYRVIQATGFVTMLASPGTGRLAAVLLGLWCAYILAINGPVASPKYRLPLEPPLAVFAAVGLLAGRRWLGRNARDSAQDGAGSSAPFSQNQR